MTPQEQQMIDGLISRIRSTPVGDKDSEAERHIQQGLAGYDDALYILVQTVLVQQYGLEQAQRQLNDLKEQVQSLQSGDSGSQGQKSTGGSFLSHIFGGGTSAPQQPSASASQQGGYQHVSNEGYRTQGSAPPPPPVYSQGGYPPQTGGMFGGGLFGSGGSSGFMRGALQTAAGVAAGEMVFRGMEDIFGGFGGGGHAREFAGASGGETIVNNYYDEDRGGDRSDSGSDRSFYDPSDDASRSDLGSDSASGGSADLSFADSADDGGFGSDDSGSFDGIGGDDFNS